MERGVGTIRQEMLAHRQAFLSYQKLVGNERIRIGSKKLGEVLGKCAGRCKEIADKLKEGGDGQEGGRASDWIGGTE